MKLKVGKKMARKRMIDPDIWNDEDCGLLSDSALVLFIACFSNADDEGYITGSSSALKKIAFGFKDYTNIQVEGWLEEIANALRSFHRYEVRGKQYIELKNWKNYQTIDRPKKSIIPKPITESTNVRRSIDDESTSVRPQTTKELNKQKKETTKHAEPEILPITQDVVVLSPREQAISDYDKLKGGCFQQDFKRFERWCEIYSEAETFEAIRLAGMAENISNIDKYIEGILSKRKDIPKPGSNPLESEWNIVAAKQGREIHARAG